MTRKSMKATLAAICAALALLASACSSSGGAATSNTTGGGGGSAAGKRVTLLMLSPSCATCTHLSESVKSTLAAQGVKVTTVTSEFGASADQIQKFNQALSTKPDAIVIWPTDTTSIIPSLARAKQTNPNTKIIITTYKPATSDDSLYAAYVGADDAVMGAAQAQELVNGLKAIGKPVSGSVLEIEGAPGAATTIQRKQGFDNKLKSIAPGLKIVASQTANWDQTQATTVASSLFSRYSGGAVVGVFAQSDVMLNGVLLAAQRSSLTPGKNFIAVGIDCDPEGYNNIKAGKQYATTLWDPYLIGSDTGKIALQVLKGQSAAKVTTVPTPTITKDNTADCAEAIK